LPSPPVAPPSPDCALLRTAPNSNPTAASDAAETPLPSPPALLGARFSTGAPGGNGTWTNEPVEMVELESGRSASSLADALGRAARGVREGTTIEEGNEGGREGTSRPDEVGRLDEGDEVVVKGRAARLGESTRPWRLAPRGRLEVASASHDSSAVGGGEGGGASGTLPRVLFARRTERFLSLGSGLRPGGSARPEWVAGGEGCGLAGGDEGGE